MLGKKVSDPKTEYFEKEFIKRLKAVIADNTPNIIICADSQSLFLAQTATNNRIPTIAMCHTDPQSILDNVPQSEMAAWKNAYKVQVLLESYRKSFLDIGIHNIICIPNVVPQFSESDIKNKYNTNTIVWVGRLEKIVKRPHILIDVFSLIAADFPQWNIKFYGSDDNAKYLNDIKAKISQHNLNNIIEFCGITKDIFSVMKEAEIFVSTSKFEGFPLAVTEAMSIGLPVVGFRNCNALADIIIDGETGILADDVSDMANKLSMLMENKILRKNIGYKAHLAMSKFSPEVVWDKWKEIVEDAISAK
ncbi:MAG: glycosyltransferase [Phascolarctobacterium sp.]|uniref:glycosyltransferase n=1 Tax=Phascolarctobacterium sp. TaxID=2049039 RepID=UPI0026DB1B2A|nr:glycosyltransferase [Phascolarctobacterium sp.]MDO4920608.1 glycosyltransferase [Phascolarctobacterium sp.]